MRTLYLKHQNQYAYKLILLLCFKASTWFLDFHFIPEFIYQHKHAHLKALSLPGKREANQSMEFLLALKSEHIRSALLDEFSSREACSSSVFCSSKVGTYCSQEESFLRISGHGDVFITLKNVRILQRKVLIFVFPYNISFDLNVLWSTLK